MMSNDHTQQNGALHEADWRQHLPRKKRKMLKLIEESWVTSEEELLDFLVEEKGFFYRSRKILVVTNRRLLLLEEGLFGISQEKDRWLKQLASIYLDRKQHHVDLRIRFMKHHFVHDLAEDPVDPDPWFLEDLPVHEATSIYKYLKDVEYIAKKQRKEEELDLLSIAYARPKQRTPSI